MNNEWKQRIQKTGRRLGAVVVALSIAGAAAGRNLPKQEGKDGAAVKAEGKFYCNVKALSLQERARLKELTARLLASRIDTIEIEKGYEFQYSPEKVSIAEVGEWVVLESKCCSFFDFHIDLENQGKLVCLRLTGSDGIKAFIRSDFHIS
jgi:hypothetical protein